MVTGFQKQKATPVARNGSIYFRCFSLTSTFYAHISNTSSYYLWFRHSTPSDSFALVLKGGHVQILINRIRIMYGKLKHKKKWIAVWINMDNEWVLFLFLIKRYGHKTGHKISCF